LATDQGRQIVLLIGSFSLFDEACQICAIPGYLLHGGNHPRPKRLIARIEIDRRTSRGEHLVEVLAGDSEVTFHDRLLGDHPFLLDRVASHDLRQTQLDRYLLKSSADLFVFPACTTSSSNPIVTLLVSPSLLQCSNSSRRPSSRELSSVASARMVGWRLINTG